MEIHYLNRSDAAEYVRGKGLRCTKATLAKLACVGGGPIFQKFGRDVVHTPANLDLWIAARLSGPKTSTSDQADSEAGSDLPHSTQDCSQKNQHDGNGQARDDSPAMAVWRGAGG